MEHAEFQRERPVSLVSPVPSPEADRTAYVYYDSETTGFDVFHARIYELGALFYVQSAGGEQTLDGAPFLARCNTARVPIPHGAGNPRRLSAAQVASWPSFAHLVLRFQRWLYELCERHQVTTLVLAAHNGHQFDHIILFVQLAALRLTLHSLVPSTTQLVLGDSLAAMRSCKPFLCGGVETAETSMGKLHLHTEGTPLQNAHTALADAQYMATLMTEHVEARVRRAMLTRALTVQALYERMKLRRCKRGKPDIVVALPQDAPLLEDGTPGELYAALCNFDAGVVEQDVDEEEGAEEEEEVRKSGREEPTTVVGGVKRARSPVQTTDDGDDGETSPYFKTDPTVDASSRADDQSSSQKRRRRDEMPVVALSVMASLSAPMPAQSRECGVDSTSDRMGCV